MKIQYFNYLFDITGVSVGAAVKIRELFNSFDKESFEIDICWLGDYGGSERTSPQSRKFRYFLKKYFAVWIHDPKLFLKNILYLLKERQNVLRFNPDLIIGRLDYMIISTLITAKLNHLPFIVEADCPSVYETVHFTRFGKLRILAKSIEKFILRRADYIICQSRELQDYFLKTYQLDESKITWISNGTDPEKIKSRVKNRQLLDEYKLSDNTVIGFIGSLSVWHGIENLTTIFQSILNRFDNVRFLIVGTGGRSENEIVKYLSDTDYGNRILLTGYIPYERIPEYLNLMDIVLAPYPQHEFFYFSPLKLFEYMAGQKPVVTTPVGQITDIIKPNENGCFANPENSVEMVEKISYLIHNPKEADRIGLQARKTIVTHYTWAIKAKRWMQICQNVAKHKNFSKE